MKINWHRIAFIAVITYAIFNQGACEVADAQTVDELPISLELTQMDTQDFAGTEFYQLKRGNLILVVSTDPANDAAKWLKKHTGQKIVVTLAGRD